MRKRYLILLIFLNFTLNVNASEIDKDLNELISKSDSLINNSFLNNHPVGSIYETINSNESTIEKMHNLYGGTWEVYGENKVFKGTTDDINGTGGAESKTVNSTQIPTLSVSGTKPAQNVTSASTGTGYSVGHTSATRTTSSNGTHNHGYTAGGYAITIGGPSNAGGIPNNYGFNNANNSWWWSGHNKQLSAVAGNGSHNHIAYDYYVVGGNISGVQSHAHDITMAAQTITSTYTNNSQSNINVLDPYITVYRYKRVS